MAPKRTIPIDTGWLFRQADDASAEYLPTQGFPTEIHRDLLHHDLIPDPFTSKNENDVQWVGEKTWIYKTTFVTPARDAAEGVTLAFDGLDTYATVYLNGLEILKTQDMFIPERVDVTGRLLSNPNTLVILFESAYLKGKQKMEGDPSHVWKCWNGDPSRLAVRKAQYHYGWDWGPCLMTCGPWRPIYLDVYGSRISDLYFRTEISPCLDVAEVAAKAGVEGRATHVQFEISMDDTGIIMGRETVEVKNGHAETIFATGNPRLWYPRKYGQQPMYRLSASLLSNECVVDSTSKRFALRRVEVVQQRLEGAIGTSFMFQINNIPMFCGGSNWIPTDSFLTRVRAQKYFDWVKMAAEGNQAMLRVWGGGIYEHDAFYDACDELGVLVWQDFMFACGNYPAFPEFLDLIKREAIANVKRLRHHPSIVLWAGNNEDYQIAETEKLEYDPREHDEQKWLQSTFPARYIYERVLVDITSELIPDTYYHFGSPYGGDSTRDTTRGDIHQWNVWHGTQEKYQDFDRLCGRFVSEFGMQASPNPKTVDRFFRRDENDERHAESSVVSHHNKAAGHDRRLAIYLTENLRYRFEPLDYYIYCTQLMQAEALSSAFSAFKRQWKGPGREYCAGALVWQTNDCWPCTSWSIADHDLRPKLAYYAVKREMQPVTVGMKRVITKVPADKYTGAYVKTIHTIEVWACNFTLQPRNVETAISTIDLDSGTYTLQPGLFRSLELLPNRATEIMSFKIPVHREDVGVEAQTVVCAGLTDPDDGSPKYVMNWPDPLKYVHLPKPCLRVTVTAPSRETQEDGSVAPPDSEGSKPVSWLNILSHEPLKGVQIELDNQDNRGAALLEDNGFDLMPDKWAHIKVSGLQDVKGLRARILYLGGHGEQFRELEVVSHWEDTYQ